MSQTFHELVTRVTADPGAEEELGRRFGQRAAVISARLGGFDLLAEHRGPAFALGFAHQVWARLGPILADAGAELPRIDGGRLLAVTPRRGDAILGALEGHRLLARLLGAPAVTMAVGVGDLLVAPDGRAYGAEVERARAIASLWSGDGIACTELAFEGFTLPPDVGAHRAPKGLEALLGVRFHLLRDYREPEREFDDPPPVG